VSRRAAPGPLLAGLALAALLTAPAGAQQQPTQPGWPQPIDSNEPSGYAVLHQNELRAGDGQDGYRWDAEGWYGDDLNRAWLRTEGTVDTGDSGRGGTGRADGATLEEAEVQLLYSRSVSAFFNLQAGVRQSFAPGPSRTWAALGVTGLTPLFLDIDALAFISDGGHAAARIEGYYDLLLTQRLILQPQFELNAYSRSDRRSGVGAGLSDLDTGLRLRYEIRRQFAPYIGVSYQNQFGQTAAFTRRDGAAVEQVRFTAGIRAQL
jgi:copper resistance protein B